MRLTLLFTTAALGLILGGGALFITQLQHSLDNGLTMTLATRADIVGGELAGIGAAAVRPTPDGPASETPPPADRGRSPQALLQHAMRVGVSGTYAQLLTSSGRVVAGSRLLAPHPLITPGQARRARHHTLVFDRNVQIVDPDGRSDAMRLLTHTVRPSGDILVIALSRTVVDDAEARARSQIVLLGVAVVVLAGPGAYLLTGAALRPVERMRREVRDLEARNADTGLRVPKTRDEIARLAETFNTVLSRMHAAVTREQALVADAGHELRTPLTVLKGELELARRPNRTAVELLATVDVAAEETDRLIHLTEDLLFLSREEVDRRSELIGERFDVVTVAQRAVDAVSGQAAGKDVRLEVAAATPVPCTGNSEWVRRAVDNLLTNALRHVPRGGAVCVAVTARDGAAELRVSDTGPGFPPEFLPRAFDRFSRADDARERTGADAAAAMGSGLGLAIVRSIVIRHGGTATAGNRPEGGAEVTLSWPLTGASVGPE